MATLSIPKNYLDGTSFFESDLDDIRDAITTFMNNPDVENDNVQTDGINAQTDVKVNSVSGDKLISTFVDDSTLELASNVIQVKAAGIVTAKLADGAVTYAKTDTLTRNLSSNVLSAAGTGSFSDIASTSITSTGRPLVVRVSSTSTGVGEGRLIKTNPSVPASGSQQVCSNAKILIRLLRDSTDISGQLEMNSNFTVTVSSVGNPVNDENIPMSFIMLDQPAAGTYTYKIQMNTDAVNTINDLRIEVFEIY